MESKLEEMQFIGVFGIYKEACKIISSWRKIFAQITLVFILPQCFLFFLDSQVSHTFQLSERITTTYWLFKVAYFTILLVFSLLSTSGVAYAVACIYDGSKVSFKKIISIVPKVWKRVMLTILCTIIGFLLYIIVAFAFLWPLSLFMSSDGHFTVLTILIVMMVLLSLGLVYLSVVWQLASVVSVLENVSGVQAMSKSMELTKGKTWVTFIVFATLNVSSFVLQHSVNMLADLGGSLGMVARVSYGIICFLLLLMLILFSHTVQMVVYFVCKSYHGEDMDKSILSYGHHIMVYVDDPRCDDQQEDVPSKTDHDVQHEKSSYV